MDSVESREKTPSFLDLIQGISEYLQDSYHEVFVECRHTSKLDSWGITTFDMTCVAVLVAVLSTLRYILDNYVARPLTRYYDIPERNRRNVPEHLWRFIYFVCIFCYEWYVVILSGKNKFFQNPETMWHGWSLETSPSEDIYCITVIHIAFYLHWTYATIFLDTWRKDSAVMVLHHFVVLFLLFIGKAIRWENLGVLAFFLHDMCDFFLDFSKLCSLFKIRDRKVQKWMKNMRNVAFECAIVAWCISRLYWFPLKVVYSAAVHPRRFNLPLNIPYGFLMNLLLWIQVILNYYWFTWLVRIVYKVVSDNKIEDIREYDNAEKCSVSLYTNKERNSGILKNK